MKIRVILMEKEYWMNSQFSVAKFSGSIRLSDGEDDRVYYVVNAKGAISWISIGPNEPADLVDEKFIGFYSKLGRDAFIQILKDNPQASRADLMDIYKERVAKIKEEKAAKKQAEKEEVARRSPTLDFQ